MTSTTRARERMRCNHRACRTRFTLKRKLDTYVRPVRCPACHSSKVSSVEGERRREMAARNARGELCRCAAYPFPHTAGSMRMCERHPQAEQNPGDDEIEDYRACLETPRSGFM